MVKIGNNSIENCNGISKEVTPSSLSSEVSVHKGANSWIIVQGMSRSSPGGKGMYPFWWQEGKHMNEFNVIWQWSGCSIVCMGM